MTEETHVADGSSHSSTESFVVNTKPILVTTGPAIMSTNPITKPVTTNRFTVQVPENTGNTSSTVEDPQNNVNTEVLEKNIGAEMKNDSHVTKDMEIIPSFPTTEIVLKFE